MGESTTAARNAPWWLTDPGRWAAEKAALRAAGATVRRLLSLFPAALLPFCAGVPAMGVGHPASHATRPSRAFSGTFCCSLPSFQSRVVGVGQADTAPVVPISDVRRTDARSRKRDTPEGVTHGFQVSVYKVDPRLCVLARNLFSKDD